MDAQKLDRDLTGMQFGRWMVLCRGKDRINKHGHHTRTWICECSCDKHTVKEVLEPSLLNHSSTSCGCKRIESVKNNKKHGLSGTRIKRVYYNMHSRCENPNTPKFYNYGGRGIKVCDEWSGENGLINFYNWAMINGYSEDLTLDRIDDDGNYEPSNCRWINYETQNLNKRNNRLITIDGKTQTVTEWSNEYRINRNTLDQRIRSGISDKDLLVPRKLYPGCSSGFVGVYYRKDSKKWRASINKDGVKYNLGTYENLKDAVEARLNGELKYYGKYLSDIKEIERKLMTI